jgi:hypothetical protein
MSRTAKTMLSIIGIIVAAAVVSVIVYYIGTVLGKSIVAGAGAKDFSVWKKEYLSLVKIMGGVAGIALFFWYLCSRFFFRITMAFGEGKRGVWGIIMFILIALCFVIPYAFASASHGKFIMHISISLLFAVFYGVIYYWLVSILVTADAFKYTPIGAMAIRRPNNRK